MKSKAVGLRLPMNLWEQITEYGCENYPKPDGGEKEFDITSTLLDLINKGLGNDGVEQPDTQTIEQIVKEIIEQNIIQVEQQKVSQLFNNEEFNQIIEDQVKQASNNLLNNNVATKNDLKQEIANLRKEFQTSMAKQQIATTEDLPSEIELKHTSNQIKDETPIETVEPEFKPIISDSPKLLSIKEAFDLAQSRGFTKAKNTFLTYTKRGDTIYGIKKHSSRGKYQDLG